MYYHNENSFVAILVIDLQDESFVIVFMMVDLTLWLRTMKLRKATITWATRKDELVNSSNSSCNRKITPNNILNESLRFLIKIVEFREQMCLKRLSSHENLCSSQMFFLVTWLILPVVIRSSQRLSHACVSINDSIQWNCERLIISELIYLILSYYLDNRSNSRANTCVKAWLRKGCIY